MRKSEGQKVVGIFVLYLAVFFGMEIFFEIVGVWDHDRPWWLILAKSLTMATVLTVFFNWKFLQKSFKKKSHEQKDL